MMYTYNQCVINVALGWLIGMLMMAWFWYVSVRVANPKQEVKK